MYVKRPGVSLFKQMMIEIPHIPIGTAHVLVGLVAAAYWWNFKADDELKINLQPVYTVMRSDDPRIAKFAKEFKP